ncbi:MAG: hypothetical protein U0794_18245 [Isosphaeraceae bacterium]
MPLPEPARTVPATSQEIDAPWVLWPGSIEAPGTLTVISSSPVQAIGGLLEGASSPSPVSPTAVSPTIETNFRVPVGVNLGRLRWDQDPPRVNVLVDSRLTIQPDALDWTAQVRYDVWGRPLDAINLRLPSEWAATATVELLGTSFQQISETRGNLVDWSIRPDRPVWGSQRLVIRATIPFSPDSGRSFPEIRPLGRGGFDSYLRIINATRQGLAVEGSPGLQPIAPTAIPADSIFDSPAEGGTTVRLVSRDASGLDSSRLEAGRARPGR